MLAEVAVRRRQLWTPAAEGDGRCLTVVDDPVGVEPCGTVCLAHGLTGDRSGPAELLAQLAAELCRRCAVRVVRFDARGSADSGGTFEATTFAGMADDFVSVARAHTVPGLPLVAAGISIGGVPAVQAATRLAGDGPLRLGGVLLLSSDLIEGVRFAAEGRTAIRGGEFHLPPSFFRERERIRPRGELMALGVPSALVYGSADTKLADAAAWFAARGTEVTPVECDHLFESQRSRRVLFDACAAFVRRTTGTEG